jgi:hypothetical protein
MIGILCTMTKWSAGWTGTLSFKCDSDVDLKANPLSFDLSDGVTTTSFWGMPCTVSFKQNGATLTLSMEDYSGTGKGYVQPAGQEATLSFSPSSPNFTISNFSVGPTASVTLQLVLPAKPVEIEDGSLPDIKIQSGDTIISQVNKSDWGQTVTLPLKVPGEKVTLDISVPDIPTAKGVQRGKADPARLDLKNGSQATILISYQYIVL